MDSRITIMHYTIPQRIYFKLFPFLSALANLAGRDTFIWYRDSKLYYDFRTDVGNKLFYLGAFEKKELSAIEPFLREDSVALDIGANIGTHAVFMASIARNGKVFAFEPGIPGYRFLLKNCANFYNIIPVSIGCSNKNDISPFFNAMDNAYSGLQDTGIKKIMSIQQILTIKIDDFVKLFGLNRVDFIKIDVEGLEDEVIEGAQETLRKYRPVVFSEILKKTNSSPEKTIGRFTKMDYRVYFIEHGILKETKTYTEPFYNYLFVPEERA